MCLKAYSGESCEIENCPNNCSNNGECVKEGNNWSCKCNNNYNGIDCSSIICPNNCSNQGTCDHKNGTCRCNDNYFGLSCENFSAKCDNKCKGTCANGKCICDIGFKGLNCTERIKNSALVKCAKQCVDKCSLNCSESQCFDSCNLTCVDECQKNNRSDKSTVDLLVYLKKKADGNKSISSMIKLDK